ncbi:MAG TPA: cytochrome c3 family protein [Nitrospirota bacterium]|nr:cytochrome c3 family protein [Nitrospirota bacterium]
MKKRDGLWVILSMVVLIVMALAVPQLFAQEQSCVTTRCHADMGKGKFVHNPVKDGSCTMCHQATKDPNKKSKHPDNLTITLAQQGADLCYMCHEPKNKKKVVHAPIQGGDCTSCHNPHQSPNKAMLKETMPKLCFQCHPDSMMKQAVMHPPVQSGDCSGCHDNHQSDFAGRLNQEGNSLCFMCHPDKGDSLKTKKVVHPPVKQSCVLCHNQHGSPHKKVLKDPVPDICGNCHPTQAGLAKKALVKHGPMTDANTCMNCHDPHYADQPKLLPMAQMDLCLGCHSSEMDTESGKIKNMTAFLEENKNGHGPLKSKDCVSCHSPHGSYYWRILVRYYPPDFYTSYSDGKYGLCFGCHSSDAFKERKTTKATGFRDGDRNLHYLHVNMIAKGRTCRACHEEHADKNLPKHVKEYLDFGGWKMPIQFIPGPGGGSCAPGCHGEKRYSR